MHLELSPDGFVNSPKVISLSSGNFDQVLKTMDATMVMFYNPRYTDCVSAAETMAVAASETRRSNHAYAAVDCTKNRALCAANLVRNHFPTFRVFSRQFPVTTVQDWESYTHTQMRQHVEQASPLSLDW